MTSIIWFNFVNRAFEHKPRAVARLLQARRDVAVRRVQPQGVLEGLAPRSRRRGLKSAHARTRLLHERIVASALCVDADKYVG